MCGELGPVPVATSSAEPHYLQVHNLEPAVQRECRELEPAILRLDQAEKQSGAASIKEIQQDLFTLRKRYKEFGLPAAEQQIGEKRQAGIQGMSCVVD